MKFEKIIISGGWAYGNVGDEAILKYTLEDISKTFPNTSITVLSYDPVVTLKEFNVDCKLCLHAIAEKNKQKNTNYLYNVIDNNYRKDALLEEYTNMFNEKTLFIMSGGGYFNDIWVESFLAHICEIKIAKMKNSKIVIMGQTIGPIEKSKHKKLFKKYITQCDYIAVRDRTSQSFLRDSFNVEARLFPDVVNRVPLPTSKDFKNIKRIAIMYQKLRPYTYEETSLLKYRIEQIKNILFRKNIKFDSSFIEFINYIMDNYPNIKLEFVLST